MRTFTVVPGHPHTWPGMPPAARTVAEFLSRSAVHRVADEHIQEHWIQLDRLGEHLQH